MWKKANVIMLPKPKKPRMLPNSYRPISLLPVISKLMKRLLLAQLWPLMDGFIRGEQFGFRREHSTTLLAENLFASALVSTFPYIRAISTNEAPPPTRVKRPRSLLDDPP